MQGIEHGEGIAYHQAVVVLLHRVWFVALAMTARIEQNDCIVVYELLNVAIRLPCLRVARGTVGEHKWRTLAFDLVVDADIIVVGIGHGTISFHISSPGILSTHKPRAYAASGPRVIAVSVSSTSNCCVLSVPMHDICLSCLIRRRGTQTCTLFPSTT